SFRLHPARHCICRSVSRIHMFGSARSHASPPGSSRRRDRPPPISRRMRVRLGNLAARAWRRAEGATVGFAHAGTSDPKLRSPGATGWRQNNISRLQSELRERQMTYVDGFVVAVPTGNREVYKKHAELAAVVFKEHGALKVVECWGDDVPDGKLT